jgi:hypothetical protein
MKKVIVLLAIIISVLSCKNQVKEVEVDRKAGEWVRSGVKYLIGSDEQVEIVKDLISNYAAMDADAVFSHTRDSLRFFSFNSEIPVMMTVDNLKEKFSSYDSIVTKPVFFIPLELDGVRSMVQVDYKVIKYNKNGTVDKDLFLEVFIFGEEGKIRTIRQWTATAAW